MKAQNFSRLKGIDAVNGQIVLRYKDDSGKEASKLLGFGEAVQRMEAMIVMAACMDTNDESKTILDVVSDLRGKLHEAKRQLVEMLSKPEHDKTAKDKLLEEEIPRELGFSDIEAAWHKASDKAEERKHKREPVHTPKAKSSK